MLPTVTQTDSRATPLRPGVSPAWLTREAWLHVVERVLATPEGDAVRQRYRVAAGRVLDVAGDDAARADHGTGRNVATSHERVGRRLGCSGKVVQRARMVLEELGLAVVVDAGRYLLRAERKRTGQIRKANTRHLVVPKHLSVHLPAPKGRRFSTHPPKDSPTRARRARRAPRGLDEQRLAADLDRRLPYLARGRHVGHLCNVLAGAGVDPRRWTGRDVQRVVDEHLAERGWTALGAAATDPLAWFAAQLRAALASGRAEPGSERARRAAGQARARAAERHREHAELEAQRVAPPPDRMAAIRQAIEQARMRARRHA